MADLVPEWGGPSSPEVEKMVDEAVKARQEFVKSNEYVIRTTRSYLKNMTCMVPNEHHRTYSDKSKLLCATMPASLIFKLVEYMEKGEVEAERIEKMSWDDLVEYMQGRMN